MSWLPILMLISLVFVPLVFVFSPFMDLGDDLIWPYSFSRRHCEKGEAINVFNHGKMLRDFTYVDDIVTGVVNVILNPAKVPVEKTTINPTKAPYKIYNIGNNNPVKLMDFIRAIEDAFGKKFEMKHDGYSAGRCT